MLNLYLLTGILTRFSKIKFRFQVLIKCISKESFEYILGHTEHILDVKILIQFLISLHNFIKKPQKTSILDLKSRFFSIKIEDS